jgi:hypothetical protein
MVGVCGKESNLPHAGQQVKRTATGDLDATIPFMVMSPMTGRLPARLYLFMFQPTPKASLDT